MPLSRTGTRVGQIKNCKKGDATIELGAECEAHGARIVVEAKEDKRYGAAQALAELEMARKNRGAQLGLFVLSRHSAAPELDGFVRHGDDVLIVWDRDDPSTDVLLEAAHSRCRALAVRGARAEHDRVDFSALDRAIRAVEKQALGLDEIKRSAQTIESGSQKILARVRVLAKNLTQAVEILDTGSEAARRALSD